MGNIINEKNLIQSTIDMDESILQTQYTRFLQESPTFVTYYRINNVESTSDQGFMNVERTIGPDSSVRYSKITNLPIYGFEQILLSLDEDEEGLDMNYEGSAIVLPGTIVPLPSDHFYVDYLGKTFVFQVINIGLDTVRSNPFYRIEFKIRSIDDGGTIKALDEQVTDHFECIHTNIGTEDKVLVKSADINLISKLNEIKKSIEEYYIMSFFDNRYNSFLYNHDDGTRYYDRALTLFMSKVNMFNEKGTYKTIKLTNEAKSSISKLEYHNSIYRALENKDVDLLKVIKYHLTFVGDFESVFSRWQDGSIRVIEQGIKAGNKYYIRPDLIELFKNSGEIFKPINPSNDESNYIKERSIIVPDENMRPVYVPEADIRQKFTSETTIEEAAKIPRGECVTSDEPDILTEDGSLNLDALFGDSSENIDAVVLEVPKEEIHEQPVDIIVCDTVDEPTIEPEEEQVPKVLLVEKQEFTIPESKFVLEKNIPSYLVDTEVQPNNIMEVTIAKYFGGHLKGIRDLDLDALEDYLDYVDINSLESFILTPMLLYVLSNYTKQS